MEPFLAFILLLGLSSLHSTPHETESCKPALRQQARRSLPSPGSNQTNTARISATKECISKLRDQLGISPDLAYLECRERAINSEVESRKNRFKLCIQKIQGTPKILKPVRKYRDGYLVDLGPHGFRTPETFWKEGGWWRKHGCTPLKEMEHWTKDNIETAQRHRWFRYGKCSSQGITLGVWSESEALNYCDRKVK